MINYQTVEVQEQTDDMGQLTKRQREILNWIKRHVIEHGVPPTRTEIAHGVGLADASSVAAHLKRLEQGGWIKFRPNKARSIRVLDGELPLVKSLAEVAAGTPIVCEAHILQRAPGIIAEQFWPRPDYLLIVRGDSMDRTGVRDKDVIAVARTTEAKSGDVVVARFGDEVTVKRFVQIDERHVELRPESTNPAHEVLKLDLAKHVLDIDGVVVGALIKELRDQPSQEPTEQQNKPGRLQTKTEL